MADTFELTRDQPTIVNTDLQNSQGIHWIVALILNNGQGFIFDPLGPKNIRQASDGTHTDSIIKSRMKQMGARSIHVFPYQTQMSTNSLCGWHSIYVAKLIESIALKTIKSIDAAIIDEFGREADLGDIEVLRKAFQ